MSEAVHLVGIDPSIVRRIDNALLLDSGFDLFVQRFCHLCQIHSTDEALHFHQVVRWTEGDPDHPV